MRVIHVSPTAFGTDGLFGGGERYPAELARALARRVECRLVTFGSRAATLRIGDLDVTVLRPPVLVGGHPAHPFPRGLISELAGADLVHAHHLRALPSRIAAIGAWSRTQRRVVTDHGLGRGRGPQLVARLFERFLTVSRYSAETLDCPPARTTIIYGGADIERFRPEARAERSGILFVGRLTPHKGIDRLIRALPDDARLTLAGTEGHDPRPPESGYPALLERLAQGRRVQFAGGVDERELPSLYRRARAFVLPSVYETCYGKRIAIPELLGLSVLEAMASGTPVVVTRVGGLPEVVVEGETGFVVEPGDVDALRDRIEQLLGDRALAVRMGENARQHVVENFTWDDCAARCLAAYEDLLGAA